MRKIFGSPGKGAQGSWLFQRLWQDSTLDPAPSVFGGVQKAFSHDWGGSMTAGYAGSITLVKDQNQSETRW